MAAIYKCADAAELKTSKVEIGERTKATDHYETAVTVRGAGSYGSLGKFCEAIEGLPAPVRIRELSAAAAGSGVNVTIDFLVLTQQQ